MPTPEEEVVALAYQTLQTRLVSLRDNASRLARDYGQVPDNYTQGDLVFTVDDLHAFQVTLIDLLGKMIRLEVEKDNPTVLATKVLGKLTEVNNG